jgi:hypothetical protein
MTALELTRTDILNDIEVFKRRMRNAQEKLAVLSRKANGCKERKKLRLKRSALRQEIEHVNGLIVIAQGALSGRWNDERSTKNVISQERKAESGKRFEFQAG